MKFSKWFEAQHGKRPSDKPSWVLEAEVNMARASLAAAQGLYEHCEAWDARFQSALYAWQIKDEEKK